jgi:hypothetical protein
MRTRLRSSRVIDSSSTPINPPPQEASEEVQAYTEPEQPSGYEEQAPVAQADSYEAPVAVADEALEAPASAEVDQGYAELVAEVDAGFAQVRAISEQAYAEQPVGEAYAAQPVEEPPAEPEPPTRGRRSRGAAARSVEADAPEVQEPSVAPRAVFTIQRFGPWVEQQLPAYQQMQGTVQERINQLIQDANSFSQQVKSEVDRDLGRYAEERQSHREELEEMRQAMNDLRSVMSAEQEAHLESLLQMRQAQETRLAEERGQAEAEVEAHLTQAREARERLLRDAYAERDHVLAETRRLSGRLGELQKMMQGLFGGGEAPPPIPVPEPVEQYQPVPVSQPAPEPEQAGEATEEPSLDFVVQYTAAAPEAAEQPAAGEGLVETYDSAPAEQSYQGDEAGEPASAGGDESAAVSEPLPPLPEPDISTTSRPWRTERRLVINGVRTLTLASDLLDRLEQLQSIGEASLVEFEHGALVVHVRHAANLALEQLLGQEFRDVLEISGADDNTIIFSTRS